VNPDKNAGKNLNYFIDEHDGSTLVNFWPGNMPHIIYRVDLDKACGHAAVYQINTTAGSSDDKTPEPSFATIEELNFPFLDQGLSPQNDLSGGSTTTWLEFKHLSVAILCLWKSPPIPNPCTDRSILSREIRGRYRSPLVEY
jgi:hypothetical protein